MHTSDDQDDNSIDNSNSNSDDDGDNDENHDDDINKHQQDPPSDVRSAKRRRIESLSPPAKTAAMAHQTSLLTPSATPSESQNAQKHKIPATQDTSTLALRGVDEGFATWSDIFLSLDPSPVSNAGSRRIVSCTDAGDDIAGPVVLAQIERELGEFTKLKDWTKMKGSATCLRRAMMRTGSKDLGVYACELCIKRKKFCVRSTAVSESIEDGRCLIIVPLPPALRTSLDSKGPGFWAMPKPNT
jgi:hypothetical protein